MPSVQTTDALRDRVQRNISAIRGRDWERVEKVFVDKLPTGIEIYERLVGSEFIDWVSRAPEGAFNQSNVLNINRIVGGDGPQTLNVDVPMSRMVPIPANKVMFPAGTLDTFIRHARVELDVDDEIWSDIVPAVIEFTERRARIRTASDLTTTIANRLLRNHSSLGPVLRAWPALWDLLHPDDQRRQGQRPRGLIGQIHSSIGTEEEVRLATSFIAKAKIMGR